MLAMTKNEMLCCFLHVKCTNCPIRKGGVLRRTFYEDDFQAVVERTTAECIKSLSKTSLYRSQEEIERYAKTARQMIEIKRDEELKLHSSYVAD